MLNLADYGRIRVMADRLGIDTIDREGRIVVLKFRPQAKIDPVRLVALVRQRPELTLVPPAASASCTLDRAEAQGLRASTEAVSCQRAIPSPQPPALRRAASTPTPPQLVGGSGQEGRESGRVHQSRHPEARQRGSAGAEAGCSSASARY